MRISDVAKQTGMAPSAIRYYERAGLIQSPQRQNGIRIFGPDVLNRLTVIQAATAVGFTLPEVHEFLHAFPAGTAPSVRWKRLTKRKYAELEEVIGRARKMQRALKALAACRCTSLDSCARLLGGRRNDRTPGGRHMPGC